jgi:hypothetical protein
VPLTHPEFGYIGTSSVSRAFIAFVICGLVAGTSGISIFKGNPDPDAHPMNAMALAPAETLSTAPHVLARRAEGNSGKSELAQEIPETRAIKPRCPHLDGDCTASQTRRARSILALNERPGIAAVPIGHLEGRPALPPGSAIPGAVTPETTADLPSPLDVAPAVGTAPAITEAPAPAVSAKKTRTHSNHVQRRDRNENRYYRPNYNSNYYQGGYARLW